ncbi:hypothetical protein BGX27_003686 [Mortierella sp. AM989]|nr:hypothetical protein BGX27_003686 [Mortierella sp. AM989]
MLGAVSAILDAVILANAIYEIAEKPKPKYIQAAFKEYYKERYPLAKVDLEFSQRAASLLAGQTWLDSLLRKLVFSYMPSLFRPKPNTKFFTYRPQASFLPMVENRGTGSVDPQKESKRRQNRKTTTI